MKTTLALIAILLTLQIAAAPGDANSKTSVTFAWDAPTVGEVPDGYILYQRTNLTVGNWVALAHAIPPGSTNTTVPLTSLIGWPTYKGPWFFAMTATNWWGESDFSATATVPRLPKAGSNITLKAQ
jgi:hypothetical protein